MAKIVQFRGQAPQGWSKDRWQWAKALSADGTLSAFARLLGYTLAIGYANAETAECRPSVAALVKALASSKRSVLRALADLEAGGWIARLGGESHTTAARYRFELGNLYPASRAAPAPERVPELAPERVPELAPERVPELAPERVPEMVSTGANFAIPPIPPYKDKPNMNQKALARSGGLTPRQLLRGKSRPAPHLSVIVPLDGDEQEAWEEWLAAQGFPPLGRIGKRVENGMLSGWEFPYKRPPHRPESFEFELARKYAEWLCDRGRG